MKKILTKEALMEALNQRYAVKQFDKNIKLSEETEDTVKEILRLTPTSFGLQLYKFIIVKNSDIREELRKNSWNQSQITDSNFIVVFCIYDKPTKNDIEKHFDNIQKIRGISDEKKKQSSDFVINTVFSQNPINAIKSLEEWQTKQAYIALGNLMTSASLLGIDTCPIEGMDTEKYDEILGLNKLGLKSKVAIAIGTRSSEDKYQNEKKVRYSMEELFIQI